MKYFFISGFLLAGFAFSPSEPHEKQSFEGIIVYRIDVKSKTDKISTENLQRLYGKQMTLSIQENNYRMSYISLDLKEVFYLGATNKQYTLRNGIDTLFVTNCAEERRRLISSIAPLETLVVLGHECHTLINDLGATQNQYWFDPAIYMSPNNFKGHDFGYLNEYYKKAKSPYLVYKYNGVNFSLTYSAVSIQKKRLSNMVFKLPKLPKKDF